MKANELMIGDWVMWKNRKVQVARLSGIVYSFGQTDVVLAHCNDDNLLETHDIKSVSPISLTPEILEKNGFRKDDETDQWYFKSDDRLDMGRLAVGIDDGCGVGLCVMRNGAITYYCKYVHELQHYLRLIGGAKEIEL